MNSQQMKYAMERVQAIKSAALRRLEEAIKQAGNPLSSKEKWDMIKAGTATLNDYQDGYPYQGKSWHEVYDWTATRDDAKVAELERRKVAVEALAEQTKDTIMLGDSGAALEAIKKLEGAVA